MCQRSSFWQPQQEAITPGGSLENFYPSINTKQSDDSRSARPDSDVLNQSSTLDDLVSDILNDSAESTTSGSCTNHFPGPPIAKNFQEIPVNLHSSQHVSTLQPRKSAADKNDFLGGWQQYPMNANGITRAKTTMATLMQGSQNHGIFTGGSKSGVTPECSSYADVTRGSVSAAVAISSQNFSPQNSHFSTQAKLPFPKHADLHGRSGLDSITPDFMLSTLHNTSDMSGSKNGYSFSQKVSKERKHNDMREQPVFKSGFESVRGCGDFGGNPYFCQQNHLLHQMGLDSNHSYKNGMNHSDINQSNFMYPRGFNQPSLLGANFASATGNPLPGIRYRLPYQNMHSKHAPPSYQSENYFNNALLHQASGITGLPPVFKGLPDGLLLDCPPDVNKLKDYVGGTLQGSLNGCYSELHNLEKERRKYEIELSQKFLGKRITSSNGIAVIPLPADPTPVDQLICDMFKEYNRIITLTSKIRGLTKDGLHHNIEKTLDKWNETIQLVEAHRKAEISHSLRKLSPESVKQLYSQGNNLIDKLLSLMTSTRQVRTALWLSTVYALHSTNRCYEGM